jgi:hypothetical protein
MIRGHDDRLPGIQHAYHVITTMERCVVRMARCRSYVAYPGWACLPSPPNSPDRGEHDVLTGHCSSPSRGCWFGSADRRWRRDAETVGYSLRADRPSVPVDIEDSILPLDSYDTFELRKGGSCRLNYLDLIIFE